MAVLQIPRDLNFVHDTAQDQAFANALKILEQVTACGVAECASGKACGMPANCVTGMLEIFASSTQPQDARLQAGHITASLLRGHKCQRKALRSLSAPCLSLLPLHGFGAL